jgi:hypothetical protein
MASATAAVINALKYTYGVDRVLYLFNEEAPTWKILSKVKKPVGGRGQFIMPIVVQNNGAFTGITEGGALPTSLDFKTTEADFALREYTAIYDVTWKLIQDSSTNKFAFQQAISMLDDGLKRRVFRLLNADLNSNGLGQLGVLPAASNTSPISVNSLFKGETGMLVDIMSGADNSTVRLAAATVTGVNVAARTVGTSANPSGTAAGDYFTIAGTVSGGNTSLHSHGILDVISASNPAAAIGNFGLIDRTVAGIQFWQASQLGNGGVLRALTEDLLLQGLDAAREKGGGGVDAFVSDLAILRRYHEILAGERFFALSKPGQLEGGIGRSQEGMDNGGEGSSKDTDGVDDGKTPYEFSGIPWHIDPYFAANTVIGLDTEHFFIGCGENDVPRPISEIFENIPFFRQTANATFQVAWYYQMQLLSDNPASGVQFNDIAES